MTSLMITASIMAVVQTTDAKTIKYKAAVVELASTGPSGTPHGQLPTAGGLELPTTKAGADLVMLANAKTVDLWASKAKAQGADIVVFSEDFVDSGWALPSLETAPLYTERLPEPGPDSLCTTNNKEAPASDVVAAGPVARSLACSAARHQLVIVAGVGDLSACTPASHRSPFTGLPYPCNETTGLAPYNTAVAFGKDGEMLAKYHKSHLARGWGGEMEAQWSEAFPPDVVTFDTHFGVKFGMFICNDMNFGGPARALIASGVNDFVFPTFWVNSAPLGMAVGSQDAFARAHAVNFIAANADVGRFSSGSGIWPANISAPFVQHYNPAPSGQDGWMGVLELTTDTTSASRPVAPDVGLPNRKAQFSVENTNLTFFEAVPGAELRLEVESQGIRCELMAKVSTASKHGSYLLYTTAGLSGGGWFNTFCAVVACDSAIGSLPPPTSPAGGGCEVDALMAQCVGRANLAPLPSGGAEFESLRLSATATGVNTFRHSALCANGFVVPRSALTIEPESRTRAAANVSATRVLSLGATEDCPLLTSYIDARAEGENTEAACSDPPSGACVGHPPA